MRQALVFIGQNVDQEAVTHAVNVCLLSEQELLKGKSYWATLNDPFPSWKDRATH